MHLSCSSVVYSRKRLYKSVFDKKTRFHSKFMDSNYRPLTPDQDDIMDLNGNPTELVEKASYSQNKLSLHHLPKETLLHIFDYLHSSDLRKTSFVSKSLRELSLLYLWQDPCQLLLSHHKAFKAFQSLLCQGYTHTQFGNLVKRFELISSHQTLYCSETVFISVIQTCMNLKHISFKHCHQGFSKSSIIMNGLSQLHHLEFLDLSHQHYLATDTHIRLLASCKKLQVLKLSFCSSISEESLQILIRSLDLLKSLDISYIFRVSNVILKDLETFLPLLQELNISGCWNVTRYGMSCLMQKKKGLQSLIFTE